MLGDGQTRHQFSAETFKILYLNGVCVFWGLLFVCFPIDLHSFGKEENMYLTKKCNCIQFKASENF